MEQDHCEEKKPRYSRFLNFDRQAIRTKSFRKISLLDVPCPQNFIPGLNRGQFVPRYVPPKTGDHRLSSVCFQGVLINTKGNPSDTQKGLLQAGLIALSLPAPSQHATCAEHPDHRTRRAMTHALGEKMPIPDSEKIADAFRYSSDSNKRQRRFTVPLILDLTDIPPSLRDIFQARNSYNRKDSNGKCEDIGQSSKDVSFQSVSAADIFDSESLPCFCSTLSLPDVSSIILYDTDQDETSTQSRPTKTSEMTSEVASRNRYEKNSTAIGHVGDISEGTMTIKTASRSALNNFATCNSVFVKRKPLNKVRPTIKTHYATKSVRDSVIRHATLVHPGKTAQGAAETRKGRITKISVQKPRRNGAAIPSLPTTTQKHSVLNAKKEEATKELVSSDGTAHREVVVKAVSRSSKFSTGDASSRKLGPTLSSPGSTITNAPVRKVSSKGSFDFPLSKEEKETFSQIQATLRSKLPKTFRTTVKMGLFTDPVNLQETNHKKETPITAKIKKRQASQRSHSLTPNHDYHTRWQHRSNTNPDIEVPSSILADETTEPTKKCQTLNRTFPRVTKVSTDNKKIDIFSVFRTKGTKKLNKNTVSNIGSPNMQRKKPIITALEPNANLSGKQCDMTTNIFNNERDESISKATIKTNNLHASSLSKSSNDFDKAAGLNEIGQDSLGARQPQVGNGINDRVLPHTLLRAEMNRTELKSNDLEGSARNYHEKHELKGIVEKDAGDTGEVDAETLKKEEKELDIMLQELQGYIEEMDVVSY